MPKHRWIAASHSPEYREHVITGWDENSEKFFEIIRSEARVLKLAETASDQYLIAEVAYDHPTALFSPPHIKIQTIDLKSASISIDILDGASLLTTSKESSIVVALRSSTTSYQNIITVWDGRSGDTLATLTHEEGGSAASVDVEKMSLLTSIPWNCGIVATDLFTGNQRTININELGVVGKIRAKYGQAVILAHSSIEKDGDDYIQYGIYDLDSNKCTAILFRSNENQIGLFGANASGLADIGRTTGHVAIEMASGVVFLWRSFKGHRAPYLYSNSHTYNESREQKLYYEKLIRSAEEHYRFGDKKMALSCIREAREIPGYAFAAESMNLWRLISADFRKSRIRRIAKIASYRRGADLEHDTINQVGALHPNGEMLAFVSAGLEFRAGVVGRVAAPFRVIVWNPRTDNLRYLLADSTSDYKADHISFVNIGKDAFVFLGSGCSRHVICINAQDAKITKFDRGDYVLNHLERSSIAISNDGKWLVLGAGREEKVAKSPPVAIWNIATQTSVPVTFDQRTYSAFDVCFCEHHGMESLVIACNLGIQICSVEDFNSPKSFGRNEIYRMLACSQCRHFIAAASWFWPTGGKLTTTIEIYSTGSEITLIQSITIESDIKGMRLTKNGDVLLVLCHCIFKAYLVSSGELAFEININTDSLSSLSEFSEDESRISVIGYDKIDVYDLDWDYRLE